MNFLRDYLRQVFPAFWHALALTDTLVIGVFILAGMSAAAFGFFGGHGEHPSWLIALAIFLVSLLVLLVRIPYGLYAEQRTFINERNEKLARISEDRPLIFNGLSIGRYVQPHPPHGDWIIERIELGFENTGAERICWTLPELFFDYQGTRRTIPLPAVAGRYCLVARASMDYGFDVPGLQIPLQPLRVPTTIRFGFTVEYDNIPPVNVRRIRRVLDCSIRRLWSGDYDCDFNIVEQLEC
jgi:hypothetical protein